MDCFLKFLCTRNWKESVYVEFHRDELRFLVLTIVLKVNTGNSVVNFCFSKGNGT